MDALVAVGDRLQSYKDRVVLSHGSYKDAKKMLLRAHLPSTVDGMIIDLGGKTLLHSYMCILLLPMTMSVYISAYSSKCIYLCIYTVSINAIIW